MSTEVVKKSSMANFLSFPSTKSFLEEVLQEKKGEFISNLIALTDSDELLAQCDHAALMKTALNATALNLPLNKNLGYAYVIAYKNNKKDIVEPQFQIGYKGLIQLAIRSGYYKFINACEIHEGEISRNKVTGEIKFIADYPEAKVVGYLAYLELMSGFTASLYMSEAQIESHALRFSKMYQYDKNNKKSSSKWSDPLARPKMALKTVLKGLLGTYGIMTTELNTAFEKDNETEYSDHSEVRGSYSEAEVVPQPEPELTAKPEKVLI